MISPFTTVFLVGALCAAILSAAATCGVFIGLAVVVEILMALFRGLTVDRGLG